MFSFLLFKIYFCFKKTFGRTAAQHLSSLARDRSAGSRSPTHGTVRAAPPLTALKYMTVEDRTATSPGGTVNSRRCNGTSLVAQSLDVIRRRRQMKREEKVCMKLSTFHLEWKNTDCDKFGIYIIISRTITKKIIIQDVP